MKIASVSIFVVCMIVAASIYAAALAASSIGGGMNSQLPTQAAVRKITVKEYFLATLGDPPIVEKHYDYMDKSQMVAEHWHYPAAASSGDAIMDVFVWWDHDGSFMKVSFRNSETGEFSR